MNGLKKALFRPLRSIAKGIERFKRWKYVWMGKQRARYLKMVLAECGPHLRVYGKPIVFSPEKIHIGDHFTINNGCQLSPRGEIHIADYVTMSRGSQITAGTLDVNNWSDERYKEHKHTQGDVYIGEGCWLCINATVLPGVKITGKGVVVAAGAVVTKDITEDYVVYGGVPAKLIRHL